MLDIINLKSGYNNMEILHGINLKIKPGSIVAIIGPNGSGKSTVLKSIFNLCDVFSGKIIYNKKNITKLPTHALIYEGISYVPQGRQIFSDLTVKENLEMGAFILKDKELVKVSLDYVYDIFPFLKQKQDDFAYTLSGGQQQMLAIGRALMQDPEVLILDEPSLGLDPKSMKEIFNKIQEINKQGVSIIIVEQNAKSAVEVCDQVYLLEQGMIALVGGKELLQDARIKSVYFGS